MKISVKLALTLDVIAFLTLLAADSLATYLIAIVGLGAAGCVSVYAVNRLPKEDDPDTRMREEK